MKALTRRALILTLGLGGVLAAPGVVAAAPARAGDTLKSKKEALGHVHRQLEEERVRVMAARQRETSLLAELQRLEQSLARKRAEIGRLDRRIRRLEAQLGALAGARGRVAEDTVTHQAAVAARLRILARLTQTPTGPAWFGDDAALVRRRVAGELGRAARLDLGRLAEFGETAARLETRRSAVDRGRRKLVQLRREVETERAALGTEAEHRRVLLVQVREDRATHERMTGELEEAGRRLEALVRELARRAQTRRVVARPGTAAGVATPAVGLGTRRGQLPWPTEGRVVATFGRQVHPRFGTETYRRGIDIEADEGAPIQAVHGGTVLYRGWVKGYGNLIILDHGEGYYTLYGHASEFLVEEGQEVGAGQGIARVGDTGSLAGARLYFEVRYQGLAQDPEAWLKRRL